jgi:transcriptional regulator with XRE-family HTH domain
MEPTSSTALGDWLQRQLDRHQLSQMTAAARVGVGVGTISQIIRKGHIPKLDTLFRLADFFDAPREYVLHLAAGLPPSAGGGLPPSGVGAAQGSPPSGVGRAQALEAEARLEEVDGEDLLIRELLREFRRVPDEWKPVVIEQVELIRRLAERPPVRIIGGYQDNEEEGHDPQASPPQEA